MITKEDINYLMQTIKALPENWDGYNAVPVSNKALQKCEVFFPHIINLSQKNIDCDIVPTPYGTITTTFNSNSNEYVSAEIGGNGYAFFTSFLDKDKNQITEKTNDFNVFSLTLIKSLDLLLLGADFRKTNDIHARINLISHFSIAYIPDNYKRFVDLAKIEKFFNKKEKFYPYLFHKSLTKKELVILRKNPKKTPEYVKIRRKENKHFLMRVMDRSSIEKHDFCSGVLNKDKWFFSKEQQDDYENEMIELRQKKAENFAKCVTEFLKSEMIKKKNKAILII
jgi:hypothetical protein